MKKILFIFLSVFLVFKSFSYPLTPDPQISPGHLCTIYNIDFKEFRYSEKIPYCARNVSTYTKNEIYHTYGIPLSEKSHYTIDHIVPLSIGGSNEIENLWPEHVLVKATRPNLEMKVYTDLKNGKISQKQAIEIILKDKFKN